MKRMMSLLILSMFSTGLYAQSSVPAGTVLPVRLNSSVSSAKGKQEQVVTARIMQTVPLPGGSKIRAGTQVVGHVVELKPASGGSGARITIRFDTLRLSKSTIPLNTSLRALASRMEVADAEMPTSSDEATPASSWTTVQVGGEVVYRGGGHVMDGETVVGEPVYDGVLSRVRANGDRGCQGPIDDNDQPQAMWVFSSDACGTYGFAKLTVASAGRKDPKGQIVLTAAPNRNLTLRSGSGMLLRVL